MENIKQDKYDCIRLGNQICFPLYACAKEVVRQYRKPLEKLGLTYLLDEGSCYMRDILEIMAGLASLSYLDTLFLKWLILDVITETLKTGSYFQNNKDQNSATIVSSESHFCFYVEPIKLEYDSRQLEKLSNKVSNIVAGLFEVNNNLRNCGNQFTFISESLECVIERLEEDCTKMEKLGNTIDMVSAAYQLSERRIVALGKS